MGKLRSMDAPEKEAPKKTRGITKTEPRPQNKNEKPFLNPKVISSRGMKGK